MAEPSLHPHEDALIRTFIARGRREQFLRRVGNPKTRDQMLGQLAHFEDLETRYAHRLRGYEGTVDAIYQILRKKGAPTMCHVMGMSDLDGQDVDLRVALEDVVGSTWGNFISCIPGKLAYFEGEVSGERYILQSSA